jgi:hypothetical protein
MNFKAGGSGGVGGSGGGATGVEEPEQVITLLAYKAQSKAGGGRVHLEGVQAHSRGGCAQCKNPSLKTAHDRTHPSCMNFKGGGGGGGNGGSTNTNTRTTSSTASTSTSTSRTESTTPGSMHSSSSLGGDESTLTCHSCKKLFKGKEGLKYHTLNNVCKNGAKA